MTAGTGLTAEFRLDHVATEEADIEARVQFLVEVLGMRLLRWGTHVATGRRIAMLADPGGAKTELIEVPEPRGEFAHTAYRVPDVDAAHAALLAAGCAQIRAPFYLAPAKARTSFTRDPSGRQVQLVRYDPDSPDRTED